MLTFVKILRLYLNKVICDYIGGHRGGNGNSSVCRGLSRSNTNQLNVSKPSVSYATKRLREDGYITFNEDGMISLTESGMEIADKIYTRHKVLTDIFRSLGVDDEIAAEDACKIEHDLSPETFDALCKYARSHGLSES